MDVWLNPSQSRERSSKCDFCYQSGISVKPLTCSRHFYCGVCEKFAPKFYKRSDFTCSRCSGPPRSNQQKINLDLTPTTLNFRPSRKKQHFKEITVAVEGGNILTFGDADPDSEDDDLEGSNVQWDHLLQSLTSEQTRTRSKQHMEPPVNNNTSYKDTFGGQNSAGMGEPPRSHAAAVARNHGQGNTHRQNSRGDDQEEEAEEQERGSSPVKGRTKRLPICEPPSLEAAEEEAEEEEEDDFSPIGDVEGPDVSRGSVSSDGEGYQGDSLSKIPTY